MAQATELNRAYYGRLTAGRESYWRLMPAPRMRIERVVDAVSALAPEARHICDFGCGNGDLLIELARHVPEASLYGIDLSEAQITRNAVNVPSMHWAVADLTALSYRFPFPSCQVALSCEVLEHLDEPMAYLRNVYASLEPEGVLVLTTQSGPVRATERAVGHVRHWEANQMSDALRTVGFRDIHVTNCGFPFHDLSKWAANVSPRTTIRRFGEHDWRLPERAVAAALRFLFRFNSRTRGAQLVARAIR